MQTASLSSQSTVVPSPPAWLRWALMAGYVLALAALIFLPGGTLLDRLRLLDSGICAQLPTHSFYPGGQRLPLCARNTGIYLGFSLGMVLLVARGYGRAARLPTGWVAVVLAAGIVAMGIDGFNSLFLDLGLPHLYTPENLVRLATGLAAGTAMAAFLAPVVNGMVWHQMDIRAAYPDLRALAWVVPGLLLIFVAVASQVPLLLYPIALISSAGVVTALSLINLTFVVIFGGRVQRYMTNWQVAPMATLALFLAICELVALFMLKGQILAGVG